MRKFAVAAALAACAGSAQAADLFSGGNKDVPACCSWTGFYLGAYGGGASGSSDWRWDDFSGNTSSSNQDGGMAGGQIGYNWEFLPHAVAGVEGSFGWIGASGTGGESHFVAPVSNDITKLDGFLGDISARLGYADDKVFVYGKGGVAFGQRHLEYFNGAGSPYNHSWNSDVTGWLAGAGVELRIAPHWTVKAEWNHIDFGSETNVQAPNVPFTAPTTLHSDQTIETFKAGVNYQVGFTYQPLK